MSIAGFQQALCDLIASPHLCRQLRAVPEGVLAHYELTERERTRLRQVVRQPGMSTNCTLYRSNRVTPIYTLLNYTCRSLGKQFATLLEEFWDGKDYQDGQFQSEVERFGGYLRRRIADGAVASPFAAELLEFELALNALEFGARKELLRELENLPVPGPDTPCRLHPLARLIRFRHDPTALLTAAAQRVPLSSDIPQRDVLVALSVVTGAPSLVELSGDTHSAVTDGGRFAETLTPRLAPALAEAGLLVPNSC
jgi:hypothetical protein